MHRQNGRSAPYRHHKCLWDWQRPGPRPQPDCRNTSKSESSRWRQDWEPEPKPALPPRGHRISQYELEGSRVVSSHKPEIASIILCLVEMKIPVVQTNQNGRRADGFGDSRSSRVQGNLLAHRPATIPPVPIAWTQAFKASVDDRDRGDRDRDDTTRALARLLPGL